MPSLPTLVARDKRTLLALSNVTTGIVTRLLPDLSTLPYQDAGAVIRQTASATGLEAGNLATVAGVKSYSSFSDEARSKFRGKVTPFAPRTIDVASVVAVNLESMVGRSMSLVASQQFESASSALAASASRVVSDIYRETIVQNSVDDPVCVGYQRIPSAGSCSFCALVSLNRYTSFDESGGYHDHCGCSTAPVFRGQGRIAFPQYEEFDNLYKDARAGGASSADEVLQEMRKLSGRK